MNRHQVEDFQKNGLTVIPDFFSTEEVEEMKREINLIINEADLSKQCGIFAAGDKMLGDDYFLDSGDKISYFLEKDATNEKGELICDKSRALNKIGHALHWLSPVFKKYSFSGKVSQIAKSLNYQQPQLAQSMYIFKHPKIGGEVTPHQDATFLHTEPVRIMGFWFPLEDATLENGCLWFIPGSHKDKVDVRYIRNPDEGGSRLKFTTSLPTYHDSKFIAAPVKKGSCVLIDGQVVHKSSRNSSDKCRPAYTFHIIESEATTYSKENWLQPSEALPFPYLYDNCVA